MFKGGAEELPEGCVGPGIVRREEEKNHHGQTAEAGPSHEDAGDETQCYEQFGDADEGAKEDGVRED